MSLPVGRSVAPFQMEVTINGRAFGTWIEFWSRLENEQLTGAEEIIRY